MAKKQRSIILDDETFDALKSIVTARQLAGYKKTTISSVVEELIKGYLEEHGDELKRVQSFQISLFDDTPSTFTGSNDSEN